MPQLFWHACRNLGGIVLDVGANSGFYALLAASVQTDVRVIALEPNPHILPILERNVRLNGRSRQVMCLPFAASDRTGQGELFIPLQDHGLIETSSSLERSFKKRHSPSMRVACDTIDSITNRTLTHACTVTVIKVDVEGHEAAVLRGALSTIRRHRPLLFVEVLAGAEFDWLNGFLRDLSYLSMPLRTSGDVTAMHHTVTYHPEAWNHLLVPEESAARTASSLAGVTQS